MLRIDHDAAPYGARLLTDQPFQKGQIICSLPAAPILSAPTYQTLQVGPNQHLEEIGPLISMNHSCRPSTYIDTTARTVTAARAIEAGDELTYFYPSTEWEMAQPFVCSCGAPECLRLIAGARYLSIDVLRRYPINEHIRRMIAEALARPTGAERKTRPPSQPAPPTS